MVFVGDISIVFMGFINQFITRGAPPCAMIKRWMKHADTACYVPEATALMVQGSNKRRKARRLSEGATVPQALPERDGLELKGDVGAQGGSREKERGDCQGADQSIIFRQSHHFDFHFAGQKCLAWKSVLGLLIENCDSILPTVEQLKWMGMRI